jgi:transposase-like protein
LGEGRFGAEARAFRRFATPAEMYVQGVSTPKVKTITEEPRGHSFSASAISAINKRMDPTQARSRSVSPHCSLGHVSQAPSTNGIISG